ncbi:hypothetical protein DFH09DRAFT_1097766 [Mycena vulgaris]|nr:hypothetical protein DFH09DRAFT_1097766 [Mycena vulgaris]
MGDIVARDERSARTGYRVVVATFYFYFGGSAGTGVEARYFGRDLRPVHIDRLQIETRAEVPSFIAQRDFFGPFRALKPRVVPGWASNPRMMGYWFLAVFSQIWNLVTEKLA